MKDIWVPISTPLGRQRIRFRPEQIWLTDPEKMNSLTQEVREHLLSCGTLATDREGNVDTGLAEREMMNWVAGRTGLSGPALLKVCQPISWELLGWGELEAYISDASVTDIIATSSEIWVQRRGRKMRAALRFREEEHMLRLARKIAHAAGCSLTVGQPFVTCAVRGMRVNLMIPPASADGTTIIIRKFRDSRWTEEDYFASGTLSPGVWTFLSAAMKAGLTGIVCGPVGSGKTTLLQSLAADVPDHEGILTVEVVPELRLKHLYPNKCIVSVVPRLRGHEASRVTLEQLFENALHQNMKRFFFGEIRGAEAVLVLEAFQTGHSGWTTMHADHAKDAVERLIAMCLRHHGKLDPDYAGNMIAHAVDLIVHMDEFRVMEVAEVAGRRNGEIVVTPLFQYRDGRWRLQHLPSLALTDKLLRGLRP